MEPTLCKKSPINEDFVQKKLRIIFPGEEGWVMVKKETIDLQQCLEDLCLSLSHQYLPYHMGLFPFLLDTKPPHFIFGPSMSLYAPFDSLLMFPSKNPSVPYLSVTHRCQASINLAFFVSIHIFV